MKRKLKLTKQLLKWLEIKEWNQSRLAEALDVSNATISKMLGGKRTPSSNMIEKIGEITNFEVEEIVTLERG